MKLDTRSEFLPATVIEREGAMWPALLLGFLLLASNSIETSVATQVQGEKIRAIEDSLL